MVEIRPEAEGAEAEGGREQQVLEDPGVQRMEVAERSGATGKSWPVRRAMIAKFGPTPGCDGCVSLARGPGFQQVRHSAECRARIQEKEAEEVRKRKEEMEKQKKEDEEEQRRRADKRVGENEEGPSSSSSQRRRVEASEAEPNLLGRDSPVEIEESEESKKRKPGEDSVVTIDELLRQSEEETGATAAEPAAGSFEEVVQALESKIGDEESARIALEIGAVDVVELFSPKRTNSMANQFGFRPGISVDLDEVKPDGTEKWDLDRPRDKKLVKKYLAEEQPWLVTGSPPCEVFSPLRNLSNYKRDPNVVEEEEEIGRERLRTCVECYNQQRDQGGLFLHEHPLGAKSWQEPEVVELAAQEDVRFITSPMCRWGMQQEDDDGELKYVRKETGYLTNSRCIAEELRAVCINVQEGREVHKHVHLIGGGRAKAAQRYPPALVRAILRGLKKELRERRQISALEEKLTGPSPDDDTEWEETMKEWGDQFMDDITGTLLDPELVKKARKEELDCVHKERIYERVPMRMRTQSEQKKPHGVKWIDVNKGDADRPKIRSRLVAREIKRAKSEDQQRPASAVFSATPPIETVMTLISLLVTKTKDDQMKKKCALWDISRAHFMGKAQREVYIDLPNEDKVHDDDKEEMVGRLLRSMYGTVDASHIFQKDYQDYLQGQGAEFCALCPAFV